jgi:hypothetical protein
LNEGPSWIGIGAQRCGTTWFTDLLVQHPQMAVGRRPATGKMVKEHHTLYRYGLTLDWSPSVRKEYRATFTSDEEKLGEFTPYYMRASWACELAADALPEDAPILVLVRDPIDRFASALRHEMTLATGRHREFSKAVGGGMPRDNKRSPRRGLRSPLGVVKRLRRNRVISEALARGAMWWLAQPKKPFQQVLDNNWLRYIGSDATWGGLFAAQLDAWTAVIPSERFIVIQYERLRQDPQHYTDLVWKRIGLEPVPLTDVDRPRSSTNNERWQRNYGLESWLPEDYPHVVRGLQQIYRPDAERLASRFDIDLALWKRTMTDA